MHRFTHLIKACTRRAPIDGKTFTNSWIIDVTGKEE